MRSGNYSIDQAISLPGYVLLGVIQLPAPLSLKKSLEYYRCEGGKLYKILWRVNICLITMSETLVFDVHNNFFFHYQ